MTVIGRDFRHPGVATDLREQLLAALVQRRDDAQRELLHVVRDGRLLPVDVGASRCHQRLRALDVRALLVELRDERHQQDAVRRRRRRHELVAVVAVTVGQLAVATRQRVARLAEQLQRFARVARAASRRRRRLAAG